ncbi:hypothetical protein EJ03DRAFT_222127 [Teratosphaeria nubilosa]|uniref:F-box domain-containing protein n=1 Tax=Teratosphaeria nubilosa TaxID=161662 RepID=A0A6G1KWH3_9PEZI|nr:hypothetical protein EJ03DRAFT_222127 [Teratosphaeria nubilosa]
MALIGLPAELMSRISSYLDSTSALHFRLTSHEVFDKTYYEFQDRIRHSYSAVNPGGLQTLFKITQDPKLAPGIRVLRFSVYALASDLEIDNDQARELDKTTELQARDQLSYYQAFDFLMSGKAALKLESIFLNLPRVEALEIGQFSPRDMDPTAIGRGLQGARNLERYVVRPPSLGQYTWRPFEFMKTNWDRNVTQILNAVLSALSFTKTRLKRLSVVLLEGEMLHGVAAHRMPVLPICNRPAWIKGLACALQDLEDLRFCLEYPLCAYSDDLGASATWLTRFMSMMPQLRSLHLLSDHFDIMDTLWQWGDSALSRTLNGLHLLNLQHFELANVNLKGANLQNFLATHAQTLRRITLSRIAFPEGDMGWWETLENLAQQHWLSLEYLKFAYLWQRFQTILIFTTRIPVAGKYCHSCHHDLRRASTKKDYALPPDECPHVVYESQEGKWPPGSEMLLWNMGLR